MSDESTNSGFEPATSAVNAVQTPVSGNGELLLSATAGGSQRGRGMGGRGRAGVGGRGMARGRTSTPGPSSRPTSTSPNTPMHPPIGIRPAPQPLLSPFGLNRTTPPAGSTSSSSLQEFLKEYFNQLDRKLEASETNLKAYVDKKIEALREEMTRKFGATESELSTLTESSTALKKQIEPVLRSADVKSEGGLDSLKLNVVSSICQKVVALKYGCTLTHSIPAYPLETDPWPTQSFHDDDGHPVDCIRFDFDEPFNSEKNTYAVNEVMKWLKASSDWLVSKGDEEIARSAETVYFNQALKTYFGNLRRRLKDKQIPTPPTSSLGVAGPSTLASLTSPATSRPSVAFTASSRRGNVARAMALRRQAVPAYSGEEYEVLDQPHSQMCETLEAKNGGWGHDDWMHDAFRDIMKVLAKTALPDESKRASGARTTRFEQPILSNVHNAHPSWPRNHPDTFLQRWQFSPEYLKAYGSIRRNDIVPVDKPTSFADVRKLAWYTDHPIRAKSNVLGKRKAKDEEGDMDDTAEGGYGGGWDTAGQGRMDYSSFQVDGLDQGTSRSHSHSRSASPSLPVFSQPFRNSVSPSPAGGTGPGSLLEFSNDMGLGSAGGLDWWTEGSGGPSGQP